MHACPFTWICTHIHTLEGHRADERIKDLVDHLTSVGQHQSDFKDRSHSNMQTLWPYLHFSYLFVYFYFHSFKTGFFVWKWWLQLFGSGLVMFFCDEITNITLEATCSGTCRTGTISTHTVSYTRHVEGDVCWEMAQSVKQRKPEFGCLATIQNAKNMSVILALGRRSRHGASWPSCRVKSVSSAFSERPCLKKGERGKQLRSTLMPTSGFHMKHIHEHTYTHKKTGTHTC